MNHIKTYLVALFVVMIPVLSMAQVAFIEVATFDEMEAARKKASDQQLMLFVDVYATWCGPCKIMDREVYTDPGVALYMNTHFVNVRLDGETDYGRRYAADQKLQGYPSMFVFDSEGESVSSLIGFMPAEELVLSLQGTVENYDVVRKYKVLYERGTLKLDDFAKYITVVREMGNEEEAGRLASEYTGRIAGPKLTESDILVVAYHMDLEDMWWPEFSGDQERLHKVLGEDYMLSLEKIYNSTLVKAVDENNMVLISKMANELAPMIEDLETSSWDLRTQPFLQYYYYTNQVDELISYVDQRFASDRKEDHRWLYGAASQIVGMDQQYRTGELMVKGAEWFQACIDLEEHFDYYYYHGMVLLFQTKKDEAKTSFQKAEILASNDEERSLVGQVMGYINGK